MGQRWPLLLLSSVVVLCISGSRVGALECLSGQSSWVGTTSPSELYLEPGQPYNITCRMDPTHEKGVDRSSADLFFRVGEDRITSRVVNSTAIEVSVVSAKAGAFMYSCMLSKEGGGVMSVCLTNVYVGTRPKNVEDFNCVSNNWQNLTCTWTKPPNAIPTQYWLHYRIPGRYVSRIPIPCSKYLAQQDSCVFTGSNYRQVRDVFYMEMVGSNRLAKDFHFPLRQLHHYERVRAAPPQALLPLQIGQRDFIITWKVGFPLDNFPPGLHFRVQHQSVWDDGVWKSDFTEDIEKENKSPRLKLMDLSPNTLYTVRISQRSAVATDEAMWSDWAAVTVRTKPAIPDEPPTTVMGSFEVVGAIQSRTIYVYWKQIPMWRENGDDFHYTVTVHELGGGFRAIKPAEVTRAYAKFTGMSLDAYRFLILSSNKEGHSEKDVAVDVPSREDIPSQPKSFTKIAYQDGLFELSWRPPANPWAVNNYTIFWCEDKRDRPYQCEGQLDWVHIDGDKRAVNISVDSSKTYQFAIAVNTARGSSGMVWASCTVIYNRVMVGIKALSALSSTSSSVRLGWQMGCSDRVGIVEGYKIYYCPTVSSHNATCTMPEMNMTLHTGRRDYVVTRVTVDDLLPYTTYKFTVSALTMAGEGRQSDPISAGTSQAAPFDSPHNIDVRNITNSSFMVSWFPPREPNGILRFYEVWCDGERAKEVPHGVGIGISSQHEVLVDKLLSYHNYSVQVIACTVACSPKSLPVYARTDIGVPGRQPPPRTLLVNTTSVKVMWRQPEAAGGPVAFYEVKVYREEEAKNVTLIYNVSGGRQETLVTIPECVPGEDTQMYGFSVRAINVLPSGATLSGPWSDVTLQSCLTSDWSLGLIVGIVVGGALFIAVSVLCTYLMCRRMKTKFDAMRDIDATLPEGLNKCYLGGVPSPVKAVNSMKGPEKTAVSRSYNRLASDVSVEEDKDSSGSDHHTTSDKMLLVGPDSERRLKNPSGDSSGHESVSSSFSEADKDSPHWPNDNEESGNYLRFRAVMGVDKEPPAYSKYGYVDAKTVLGMVARSMDVLAEPCDVPMTVTPLTSTPNNARSTPNLTKAGMATTSGYARVGMNQRASTGYISMPSNEDLMGALQHYSRYGRDGSTVVPEEKKRVYVPQDDLLSFHESPDSIPEDDDARTVHTLSPDPYCRYGLGAIDLPGPVPIQSSSPFHQGSSGYVTLPPTMRGDTQSAPVDSRTAPQHCYDDFRPNTVAGDPPNPTAASSGYVTVDDIPTLASKCSSGYVSQDCLPFSEPILMSPKKLQIQAQTRDPYTKVVTVQGGRSDGLGMNVSMV